MTFDVLIAILLIMLSAALVRSTFGFGDGLVAMPLLALIISLKVASPLVVLLSSVLATSILVQCWRDIEFKSVWRMIAAAFIGIPIGLYFLKGSYEDILKISLGLVLVFFSLYILLKPKLIKFKSDKPAFAFGFAGGLLAGAYNTGGPPVVIYATMRGWSPEKFRATLQGFFFTACMFLLVSHGVSGFWTAEVLELFLLCLPVVVVGIVVGSWLNKRIPKGKFDKYVYYLLIIIGLVLLGQTIQGLI